MPSGKKPRKNKAKESFGSLGGLLTGETGRYILLAAISLYLS